MRFTAIVLISLLPAWSAVEAAVLKKQDAAATKKLSLRGGVLKSSGRELSMDHKNFSPLTCNADPAPVEEACATSSVTLSSIHAASTAAGTTAHIPCGTCATVDTVDGSTLAFPRGINVEGMLHFPSSANVVVETTHVFVQGVLKMDAPEGDNEVRIKMVGTENQFLVPHSENSMACDATTGCNVGKKAIVVAGGRLDIRGLSDPTCPAWTKLQSVVDPLLASSSDLTTTAEATPGPSSHALACGNSRWGSCKDSSGSNAMNQPALDTELHHVRCCSDSYLGDGWKKRPQCVSGMGREVWGESEINGVCHADATYDEAVELCSSINARLCTVYELMNDCAKWTGCGHDSKMNWSSTPAFVQGKRDSPAPIVS